MPDPRQFAPAAARNRYPILEVLTRVVAQPARGGHEGALGGAPAAGARVLEIASGSGEHAVHFAARLPDVSWQPSDPSAEARASIDAWARHLGIAGVAPAIELDVERRPWPVHGGFDLLFCANMIHIAPWSACEALLGEAPAHLVAGGLVLLYGPYKRGGQHTAPSNDAFDRSLLARDPRWGVRDLEAVAGVARTNGLILDEIVEMPANNLSLLFRLR